MLENTVNFVAVKQDIINNCNYLRQLFQSSSYSDREYVIDRITMGICFVIFDGFYFPSRFIGYKGNNIENHNSNKDKDGRDTNPIIESILQKEFKQNDEFELDFIKFCSEIGCVPRNNKRKYIAI